MRVRGNQAAQRAEFNQQVKWSIDHNQPLELLGIAGLQPLVLRMNWLLALLQAGEASALEGVIISSVGASIYDQVSTTVAVNHNPQIDPGAEMDLQQVKAELEKHDLEIMHIEMHSFHGNQSITRSSSASVSMDGSQLSTPLHQRLEQRFGVEAVMSAHQGTAVRSLPLSVFNPEAASDTKVSSRSSYLHDLKALFALQQWANLKADNILVQCQRQAIPTRRGCVFFEGSMTEEQCLGKLGSEEERQWSRQQLEDIKAEGRASSLMDLRWVVSPGRVDDFNRCFDEWLSAPVSPLERSLVVVTDPGHGHADQINVIRKQDSDDHVTILYLALQVALNRRDQRATPPVTLCLNDEIHPLYLRTLWLCYEQLKVPTLSRFSIHLDLIDRPLQEAGCGLLSDQLSRYVQCMADLLLSKGFSLSPNDQAAWFDLYRLLAAIAQQLLVSMQTGWTASQQHLLELHQHCVTQLSDIADPDTQVELESYVDQMRQQANLLRSSWTHYQSKRNCIAIAQWGLAAVFLAAFPAALGQSLAVSACVVGGGLYLLTQHFAVNLSQEELDDELGLGRHAFV